MKFFIFFIAFNLYNLTFIQAEEPSQTPEVLQAENSIHFISTYESYRSKGLGTGFFIGPNLFVTNFHILSNLLKTQNQTIHLIREGNLNFFNMKKNYLCICSL